MPKQYGFDYRRARRINDTVRRTERKRDRVQKPQGKRYPLPHDGFWAKLTAESGGKYSWRAQKLVNGSWADLDGSGAHDGSNQYARDVWGGTECIIGDVVYLSPAIGENCLIFDYTQHAGVLVAVSATAVSGDGTGTMTPSDGTGTYVVHNPFTGAIPIDTTMEACWRKGDWWAISAECTDST